jgi:hypothetical protein
MDVKSLVLLKITETNWRGLRAKRAVLGTLADATNNASVKEDVYHMRLIPMACAEFNRLQKIAARAYAWFRRETAVWDDNGWRVLPLARFMEFSAQFGAKKDEYDSAVEEFLRVYPALRENAKKDRKEMFDPNDYPDVTELAQRFSVKLLARPFDNPEVDAKNGVLNSLFKSTFQEHTSRLNDSVAERFEELNRKIEEARSSRAKENAQKRLAAFREKTMGYGELLDEELRKEIENAGA